MTPLALMVLTALTAGLPSAPAQVAEAAPGMGRAPTLADSFPAQWEYVTAKTRKNAVCCSRQAGKTSGAELAAETVLCRPGTRVIYATLIRRNGKKLFWWPLLEGLKGRGWSTAQDDANESEMMLWLPNGSFLQALSCEKMLDLERIRGDQADLFLIDECQAPRDDVLGTLITKIVPMMLAKRRGRLDLLGTVPEAEPCVFSNRLDGVNEDGRALPGWRTFGWDCFANPFMVAEDVISEATESGLTPCDCLDPEKCEVQGHIVYAREVLGKRVKDPSKLAYEYVKGRNDYDPTALDDRGRLLVDFRRGPRNAVGLDLGFTDHDAITALSWFPEDAKRRLFVRWRWQLNHLDVDITAGVMDAVRDVYRGVVVGDHGGHGAVKVLKTISARIRCEMQSKPPDVMTSVGFVNDDLRTSRLLLPTADVETALVLAAHDRLVASGRKRNGQPRDAEIDAKVRKAIADGANAPLARELGQVTKERDPEDPSKMRINKRGFHSDLSESMRYAHHAARHWAARAPEPEKDHDTKRIERYQEYERSLRDVD